MRAVGDAGAALIAAPPPTASPLFPTPAAVLGTSGAPAPSTGAPSDAVEWWSVNRHSTHSAPLTLSAARALTLDHSAGCWALSPLAIRRTSLNQDSGLYSPNGTSNNFR